ncbi:unnamed protein product [Calicophoron daubneyi]|uniref:Uncharacterized protein n=1 Tax=Calicophoron daubneyi TaxID=300641 RepID=A0AAV2TJE9_CALDB
MPRSKYPCTQPSKADIHMREHRFLKEIDKEIEQNERLRSEGGAGTSYSVEVLQQPTEPVVVEEVMDEVDQGVLTTDQLHPGSFEESDDDIQFLRGWVSKHSISEDALGELLCILRITNPSLPADPRTIMQTTRVTDIRVTSEHS